MGKEDFVEVTAKVSKRLMEMLESQKFFGWSREDFFSACVIIGADAQLSEMDFDEEKKVLKRFGEKLTTLCYNEVGDKKVLVL